MSTRTTGFPKSLRLTEASEYQKVFNKAFRSSDNSFLVLASGNGRNIARLGLAISKKHLRLSVQRNQVKRLIRESFRNNQNDLPGVDIVVLAQKRILQNNTKELRQSMTRHWEKIRKCAKS